MKGRTRWIAIGCGALASLIVLCGCTAVLINVLAPVAGLPPLVATVPPATAAQPTHTPEPISILDSEPTGGLGATRVWWDEAWPQTGDDLLGPIYDGAVGRRFIVTFVDGRAQRVEIRFEDGREAMNDLIAASALSVMPNDAQVGEIYQPDAAASPEIYVIPATSSWLADKFIEEWWFGSDPGTLTAKYNLVDGKTSTIIIATGENP